MDVLANFKTIEVESPVDKIIKQIRNSIASGQLKPGDKLPSERKLSDSFGVGRTYVRDAIKKLEFYGILKTLPQSGTIVSGTDISAMEGLIANVIKLNEDDFFHLVETRVILETYACGQAALHRTSRDIADLEESLEAYKHTIDARLSGVREDFNFHLRIAEASRNMVIKSLMQILIPDILEIYKKLNVCGEGRFYKSFENHKEILECIVKQDSKGAEEAMRSHLKDVLDFSSSYKGEEK
ncbi:FadR/GntR family transcriptional regulator [Geofilum sp. OHC36d9]|uniref:FadR/GntR family transcriptional regulator n=1 Tax=Geofilum sp. OHC36d9 TaxID=3458413 RepID=UPI0040335A68